MTVVVIVGVVDMYLCVLGKGHEGGEGGAAEGHCQAEGSPAAAGSPPPR